MNDHDKWQYTLYPLVLFKNQIKSLTKWNALQWWFCYYQQYNKPCILGDEDLEDWLVDYHFSNQSAQYSLCAGIPFQKSHP